MEVGGFRRVGKEQSGPCVRGLSLFDLRSCGPRGWLRFSGLGEIKWAVEKMRALSWPHIVSVIFFLCGSLLVSLSQVLCCFLSHLSFASLAAFFPSVAWQAGGEGSAVIFTKSHIFILMLSWVRTFTQ